MKQIGDGAEAICYQEDEVVIKERIPKSYRIKEIDEKLRKLRTRREAKILEKLEQMNFPGPRLIDVNEKDMKVSMEHVSGSKVRDILEKSDVSSLGEEIGKKIAMLHNDDLVHGDLTTSNMIQHDEIYFIDFGLSDFSPRIEDKAVDLHLFKQTLESKHHTIWEECFSACIKGYTKVSKEAKEVLTRLKIVEARGRNKH